jgi:undecaprenyl-diphosphatase
MTKSAHTQISEIAGWVRREFSILVPICVGSAALSCFALLTSEVTEGETHAFDERVLLALRTPGDLGDPIGPRWL